METVEFNPENPIYYNMNIYDKEITYGCGLIINQIHYIITKYKELYISNIYEYKNNHRKHLIQLVNNLCVIIFYLKFKNDYLSKNNIQNDPKIDTPDDWKILKER